MRIWRYPNIPYVFMVAGPREHRALSTLHTYINMLYPKFAPPYLTWPADFDALHRVLGLRDVARRSSLALDQAYPNFAPCVIPALVAFNRMNHQVFAIHASLVRAIYRTLVDPLPEGLDKVLVNLRQRYLTSTTPEEFKKTHAALTVLYTQAGACLTAGLQQHAYASSPRTADLARATQDHLAFLDIFVPVPTPQDIRQSTSLYVDSLGSSLRVSSSLLHKVLL